MKNKINRYSNYIFSFFDKRNPLDTKSSQLLNCAYNKGDSDFIVKNNRKLVSKLFNNKEIIFVNQVHSSKIFIFENIYPKNIDADGIITKNKNVLLGILTADCAPVVLLGNEYFGILHVGWRGLLNNIISNAVNLFMKKGEKKQNIKFFIGPHLKFKSFEIQSDFIENIKMLKNFSIYLKEKQNKIFFNYTKLIEDKIKELGIDNYKTSGFDTFSNPKKFFSHRYSMKNELKDCGRQISLVGYKNENCIRE